MLQRSEILPRFRVLSLMSCLYIYREGSNSIMTKKRHEQPRPTIVQRFLKVFHAHGPYFGEGLVCEGLTSTPPQTATANDR